MILNIYYKFIDFNFKFYSLYFINDVYICNENDVRGNFVNFFFCVFLLVKVLIKYKMVNLILLLKI